MDPAIRARTPAPVEEARRALKEYLAEAGLQVVYETALDSPRDGPAPGRGVELLKVGKSRSFSQYQPPRSQIPLGRKAVKTGAFMPPPSASSRVNVDPSTSTVEPPTVALVEGDGVTHVSTVRPSTSLAVFGDRGIAESDVDLEGALWDALEEGAPDSEMPEQEPPARSVDGPRATTKAQFDAVLSLAESEYAVHVSTDRPLREMKNRIPDALSRPGQRVLGPVADGQLLFVLHPRRLREALTADQGVAAFAPFPVFVYEEDGRTHVRALRPTTLLAFFGQPAMQDLLVEMEVLLLNGVDEGLPGGRVESRQPPLQSSRRGRRATDVLAEGPDATEE